VVVERHRLDAELFRELAHAERLDAARVGERNRRVQGSVASERGSRRPAWFRRFRLVADLASLL
jgi:hypothetical protein